MRTSKKSNIKKQLNTKWKPLMALFLLMVFSIQTLNYSDQSDNPNEVKEKLEGLSSEESDVLERLFLLSQEIDNLIKREKGISDLILKQEDEIDALRKRQREIEAEDNVLKEKLKQVLRQYQKQGAGGYFEMLLSSDNLKVFLQKLNILKDYSKQNESLMEALEKSKQEIEETVDKLNKEMSELVASKESLAQTIESKEATRVELENSLASLNDQRSVYESYLKDVENTWNGLKPLFKQTVDKFSKLMVSENIPYDAVDIDFSLSGVKTTLKESAFNNILKNEKTLPKLNFEFKQDLLVMSMPEEKIVLTGNFKVEEGHKLIYVVTGGSFYGLPLEVESIEDLFSDGYMALDVSYLLEGFSIEKVTLKDGVLELLVKP